MAQSAPTIPPAVAKRAPVVVRFEPSGVEIRVARGTSLIEAARRAGLPVASGCGRTAACGRCGMRVLQGELDIQRESDRERVVKERNRVEAGVRLSCLVSVSCDLTVTTSYW